MLTKYFHRRIWIILGWSFVWTFLLVLLLQPSNGALLPWDDGLAFAQTVPTPHHPHTGGTPPGPTPTPPLTITPGPGPGSISPGEGCCRFIAPPGMPLVNIEYLTTPPPGIPPLMGQGVIARIPAALPITTTQAFIPVPSGVITQPIGLINFYFGYSTFPTLATLVAQAHPTREIIARVEVLPLSTAIIPITTSGVIPTDWYVDPHPKIRPPSYIGYGAPISILAPGVNTTNYPKYAARVGRPTSPIPAPDAATAGTIATLPFSGQALKVEAIFKVDLYYADTAEKITIHLPELVLLICCERNFAPNTLVLLHTNETTQKYDIPVQAFHPICCSTAGSSFSRFTAYLLETSTFVMATMSGQISPPLPSSEPGGQPVPIILCDHLADYPCPGVPTPVIPAGLPRTGTNDGGLTLSFGWIILPLVLGLALVALYLWRQRTAH